MDKLYRACRFATTCVKNLMHSWDPEFVMLSAEFSNNSGNTIEITAELASWLSASKYFNVKWPMGPGCVTVRYKFRGMAETIYATMVDVDEKTEASTVFPPNLPKRDIVPPSEQVIIAEAFFKLDGENDGDDNESVDVTDTVTAFAGPDGLFTEVKKHHNTFIQSDDGMLAAATTTNTFFDDKIVHIMPKNTKRLEITFADGSGKTIVFK